MFIGLYESGMSIRKVAAQANATPYAVRRVLLGAGVLRSRSSAAELVDRAGRPGRRGWKQTDVARAKMCAAKARAREHAAGVSLKPNGYLEYTLSPNKGRSVHVVKMEQRIGRRLRDGEHVHHIDGDKQNNEDDNLKLLTRGEHARLHRLADIGTRKRDARGRLA